MFEPTEAITRMVDELFEACAPLGRGDVLPHETVARIVGVDPHEAHYQWCVNKLRRRMEAERGISLWSEHMVGYKLLTVQEQLDVPRRRQIRARRQIIKGLRSVEALPADSLSGHEMRVRAFQIEALRRARREITAQIRSEELQARPTPTLPRFIPARAER